jgi:GDP-L-fucose synthase
MNTLITGGSGLVGSCLKNGLKPTHKDLNLFSYEQLESYIAQNNINKIIHCAAKVGGVKANQDYLFDFFEQNLNINLNILKACKKYKLNNSVFILSTCIYPSNTLLPLKEEYINLGEPHFTNFGYAYAKRILEIGSRALKKQCNIKTSCLIPTNIYGKNDNYNLETSHVLPALIHKCYLAQKNNTDFTVWGTGKPEREFILADDFAKILELTLNTQNIPPSMIVSNSQPVSIKDLVYTIADLFKFKNKIIFDITKPEGILKKPTDNTLFKKTFPNFKFTPLEKGLQETILYFQENYNIIRK